MWAPALGLSPYNRRTGAYKRWFSAMCRHSPQACDNSLGGAGRLTKPIQACWFSRCIMSMNRLQMDGSN